MNTQKRKSTRLARLGRALKLNFVKLLRAPGGAHKVSIGFALGFGLELIVISTASLIYLAFIRSYGCPAVRCRRPSLATSSAS